METQVRTPQMVFMQPQRLIVPLFQRPYVWNEESQWEPLWNDVVRVADRLLQRPQDKQPHFLGAVVLQQVQNPIGLMQARTIIDGQQRLTTLQLLLDALHAELLGVDALPPAMRIEPLVTNSEHFCSKPEDRDERSLEDHLSLVDVAERPDVEVGRNKIVDRAGRVCLMPDLTNQIRVEESDDNSRRFRAAKPGSEILAHLSRLIAHADDHHIVGTGWIEGDALDSGSEAMAGFRKVELREPAIQRIMISVADEGGDACDVEASQPLLKRELRLQPSIRAVEDVAGHEQRVDSFVDTEVDDAPERIEGRIAKIVRDHRISLLQASEGTSEVKVGGMNESGEESRDRSHNFK